jgi:hypothetical protein
VNISYIIQVVLTILFGPVFALVYGLRDKLRLNGNRLAKLQDGFLDASAQFSIPVAIATVVRLKQSAPLYEITFLQSLTSMQFLALLSTSVATGIVGIKSKSWKRVVVIVLYSLIDFGLYMALVGYLRTSKASWESLKELSKACNAYGTNLLPGFVYFQTNNPFPHITAKEYFTPFNKKGGKFAGILIGFVTAGVVGLILLFGIVVGLVMIFVEQSALGLGLLSLGLSAGMIYFTTQMENKRTHMKRILGAEFQDDQWGFGQVLALCLWVPLLLQSLLAILGKHDIFFRAGSPTIIKNCREWSLILCAGN